MNTKQSPLDPQLRHKMMTEGVNKFLKTSFDFIQEEGKRHRFLYSWVKQMEEKGGLQKVTVEKATQTLAKINPKRFMNFAKGKIGKGGLVVAAGIVGWNLTQHMFKHLNGPQPVIPKQYERGYDILKDNMTDFGSPVKLAKVANKVIRTNKSAVRRGAYTTTRSVRNKNLSLSMYDNAIQHHHY